MELWDLYTVDHLPTGRTIVRGEKIPEGLYHIQVHVIIKNSRNEMLIQQRTAQKQFYPNLWDVSVGGGAQSGDTSARAAERETLEELGLRVNLQGRRPDFTITYADAFDDYYIVQMDVDLNELTLQPSEVQAVRWADYDEVCRMMADGSFCPNMEGMIRMIYEMPWKPW